jgi:hypothetical protein
MDVSVRAKFKVTQIKEIHMGVSVGAPLYSEKTIILEPQYDQKIAEDVSFQKATPSGQMEIRIDNPTAIERMPIGKMFYVDFTPVK